MKTKKKSLIFVIAIVAILILLFVWYLIPVKKNVDISLCSLAGEQIDAQFDISWYRISDVLKGTLTFDGIVYKSVDGEKGSWVFGAVNGNTSGIMSDYVWIMDKDMDFEMVSILIQSANSESTIYYGSAKTAEEAEEIAQKMLNE